jgi:dihydropteroate synthase
LVATELEIWLNDANRLPLVMGVLNVTPDSFSDGGKFVDTESATAHALAMAANGADLIDIGGESTRPGSQPVDAAEQIRRVEPVIRAIRKKSPVAISIDTARWEVANAALNAGADWVNDISAGRDDPAMLSNVAARGVPIILMHMQGKPATMQHNPAYSDVTAEVSLFLNERIAAARNAGVLSHRILLDPGIGFGKQHDHSFTLLRDLRKLAELGHPVVIGASRKSFIGRLLNEPVPARRIFGDAAVISWSVANGAAVLRVHDVGAAAQVTRTILAIAGERREMRTED